jgi:hypothetical protein
MPEGKDFREVVVVEPSGGSSPLVAAPFFRDPKSRRIPPAALFNSAGNTRKFYPREG